MEDDDDSEELSSSDEDIVSGKGAAKPNKRRQPSDKALELERGLFKKAKYPTDGEVDDFKGNSQHWKEQTKQQVRP